MSKSGIDVFYKYNEALINGDFAGVFAVLSDDIIWHQPGNGSLSGKVAGKDALGAHLGKFMEKSNGTFRVLTNWVSENEDLVAASVTFQATNAQSKVLDMQGIDLFKIQDDKIVEVWLFSANQQIEDEFWG